MKKFLLALLLIVPACGFAPTPSVISKTSESLVRISFDFTDADGEEVSQRCTGFKVGLTWVVTADHCIPPEDVKADTLVDGRPSRIVRHKGDLVLLEVPLDSKPILQVVKTDPPLGTPVTAIGYAWATSLHVFHRVVAGYQQGWIIVDGAVAPGMSGGPVIDESGKVVGLIQAASPLIGLNCPPKELRDLIAGK